MHRVRIVLMAVTAIALVTLSTGAQAASGYADPAFKTQWQAGEAVTQNFWGPLETAKEGQQEPYKEASGGQRLVQYFDKGRMELTNGAVTNGLLATEIIKGQVQVGDNAFQPLAPPNIAIAGDASNPAPTYAGLASQGGALLKQTGSTPGAAVSASIGTDGSLGSGATSSDPAMQIGAYDDTTQHNVAASFATYRAKAGVSTIGLAISEPFRANVKVGGAAKDVMVQIFERRALTYTASNPDAFKVEMGNIGQHYYQWRYPNGAPAATTTGGTSQTPVNLNGAVAFRLPNGWKTDPNDTSPGPPHITILGPTPTLKMVVYVYDQSNPPATLDDELASYVDAARQNTTVTDEGGLDTQIGGEPAKAYRLSGTLNKDGSPFSSIITVVFHNGKTFAFFANANANPIPNYDDINTLLATVTFP
ncbi:MAG TPA: hypothetical protein VIC60_08530 [Thermomicrobiales bacterium]